MAISSNLKGVAENQRRNSLPVKWLLFILPLVDAFDRPLTEYLRRMAACHELEADEARLLFAPDGYATGDDASYNVMMSHKQKAHEYRQAVYGPWGEKWGDLSGERQR